MSIKCCLQDILAQLAAGLTINNTCENPLPVASCPDNPLEVVVVDAPLVDDIDVDVEFVCNEATGFYDMVTVTTTNGLPGAPVTSPTEVSCVEVPGPPVVTVDVEYVCNAATGVYDEVVTTTTDGVAAPPVVTPTETVCAAPVIEVDVEYVCNPDTELYEQVTATTTDGVTAAPVIEPTDLSCALPPVVTVDTEYVCNDATELWDQIQITTTDGVAGAPVTTPTGISCAVDPPVVDTDVEYVCNPATGVYDQISTVTTDGVTADPVVTPTAVACAEPPVVTVDVEYVCNEATGFYDEVTTTITDGVAADPVVVATAIACTSPDVDVEIDYVCNEATGFYDQISTVTTDGVTADPVVTETALPCTPQPPDFETVRECRDDTIWTVVYAIAADGTVTELQATDTGQECPQSQVECVKWSSVSVQLDNTGTNFAENNTIEFTNSDGSTTAIVDNGPYAGWSQQITDWAALLDAAYAGTYDPRCTSGCGGLLPPPTDAPAQPGIVARYVNGTHCPTDLVIPVGAEVVGSSNPSRIGRKLPLYVITTPEKRGYRCVTCDGGYGPLKFEDGTDVPAADLPVCVFSCAETIPEPPLAACTFETIGPLCDITFSADPDSPDDIVNSSDVYLSVQNCKGSQETVALELVDGVLEPYEQIGSLVDCDNLEPPMAEPPPCPAGAVFEQVELQKRGQILDNSNWVDAPLPHLQNGQNYEITFTLADGTTIPVQLGPDPYFNSFMSLVPAALGCTVRPVCANHTASTCKPAHVAPLTEYGLAPAQSELWATGWFIECDMRCTSPIVRAEITAANDPAWVGAYRDDIGAYPGPVTTAFRAVTCDGVFWKDCDGNDILAPASACCVSPPATAAEPDCTHTECADDCANGSTYVNGRPPAGQPWSWGPYSGANIVEFEAALEAAGYNVLQFGEKHQICPPFGAFGEDPDAELTNALLTFVPPVEPNIDPNYEPTTECAVRTLGCNDDRRDDLLSNIDDTLESLVSECCPTGGAGEVTEYVRPEPADTEQSYGLGAVMPDGGDGVKFDTSSANISPELVAAHDAIIACINSGAVAQVVITDQNGDTVELALDQVGGDGNPQYFYGGTVVDGDPAGGKMRAMTVTCKGGEAECTPALSTVGCNDDRRDDTLAELVGLLSTMVEQNAQLIEQNAQLIECICCPEVAAEGDPEPERI